MSGVEKMNTFLAHLRARDLPERELMLLKAEAFEACAADEWEDYELAEALDETARVARDLVEAS